MALSGGLELSTAEVDLRRVLAHYSACSSTSNGSPSLDTLTILKTQQNLKYARQLVEVIASSKIKGKDDPLVRDAIRTLNQLESTTYSDEHLPLQDRVNAAFRRGEPPPEEWRKSHAESSQPPSAVSDESLLRLGPVSASKSIKTTLDPRTELLGGASELRKRGTSSTTSTLASTIPSSDDAELEAVLHHHRGLQDQLSQELAKMASQLKMNSLALGSILKEDAKVLNEASERLETSVTRVKSEGSRLTKLTTSTRGTFCLTLAVVVVVCLVFMWTFFFMWIFKKKS